jgi:RNA polymerase sigma factor (sigma-70 family)
MSKIPRRVVELAQDGDAKALETLVRGIQDRIHRLAIRMLADPQAAQDATQEILIRIVTKLSTFKGDSAFETWTYRVGTNYLLSAKKAIAADPGLSFQMFSDDLLDGLADDRNAAPEDHIMLNEMRIRCTMAMLLCLDHDHRAAYVLGEIMEFEHAEAARILDISTANFRKRLSRARSSIQDFTSASCGLVNRTAACSCHKRLPTAMAQGRVGKVPAAGLMDAPEFQAMQSAAAILEADLVAAKLQRATGDLRAPKDFAGIILKLVEPPGL